MKTFNLHKYGADHAIYLRIETYLTGNLAIQMMTDTEDGPILWNVLTVNLMGICDKNCAFIDTNNNGDEILKWIKENRLARPTGNFVGSGYCKYPEYRFYKKVLEEIDPDGYAEYLEVQKQLGNIE